MKTKGVVYILRNPKDRYYIGSTNNLERRLKEHNRGRAKFTRYKGPWQLVFYQPYEALLKARKVEMIIKRFKRKDIIEKIIEEQRINLGA